MAGESERTALNSEYYVMTLVKKDKKRVKVIEAKAYEAKQRYRIVNCFND